MFLVARYPNTVSATMKEAVIIMEVDRRGTRILQVTMTSKATRIRGELACTHIREVLVYMRIRELVEENPHIHNTHIISSRGMPDFVVAL